MMMLGSPHLEDTERIRNDTTSYPTQVVLHYADT